MRADTERLLDWLRAVPSRVQDSTVAQPVTHWYRSLTERDQLAVIWLAIFGLVLALLYLVVLPLWQYQNDARARFIDEREAYAWIESQAPQVAALNGAGRGLIDGSVATTVTQTGKHYNLVFKRLEPVGSNQASIWLEQVPFNQLVRWLVALRNDHGITPRQLEISRAADGIVDAQLILGS